MSPIQVTILVPPQVMASSLALTTDILETANRVSVDLKSTEVFHIELLEAQSGTIPGSPDILILPGLGLSSEQELQQADDMLEMLAPIIKKIDLSKTVFATSCSGVFALAQSGRANKRPVTTTWWLAPIMRERYPQLNIRNNEMVIDDGSIITAGAALAHTDMMLHLVDRFLGAAIAYKCRSFLMADERTSQHPYVSTAIMIATDPPLRKAEAYVGKHMKEAISSKDMATAAGLGVRTFARRLEKVAGLTPIQFLQNLRVSRAIALATRNTLSSDEIAAKVGYSDSAALRRVMKNLTGKTLGNIL
ncbi:MAG: helix-turn-helix domain-containing protein [Sneathiella sp.]